jgi:hypothetical protein
MKATRPELPDRVLFVNLRDGKVFYDCHPAEARAAIETVEEIRSNHGTTIEEQQLGREVADVVTHALVAATGKDYTVCCTCVTPHLLSEMFTAIESLPNGGAAVTHIVMNAVRFGDIRKFNKDVVDPETKVWKLRHGFMAKAWGAKIIVSGRMPADRVVVMSANFKPDGSFRDADAKLFVFPEGVTDTMQETPAKATFQEEILERLTAIEDSLKRRKRKPA